MVGIKLVLTNKTLDEACALVPLSPIHFEANFIKQGTGTSPQPAQSMLHFAVGLHGGAVVPPFPGRGESEITAARLNSVDFYTPIPCASGYLNNLAGIFGATVQPQQQATGSFAMLTPDGNPLNSSASVAYQIELISQLPNNIRLYSFAFTMPAASGTCPARSVAFNLTSNNDGAAVIGLFSSLHSLNK